MRTCFSSCSYPCPQIRTLEGGRSSQGRIDSYFTSWRTALPDGGRLGGSKRLDEAIRKVRGEQRVEKEKVVRKRKVKGHAEIEDDPRGNKSFEKKKKTVARKESKGQKEVSLVGRSCGIVISASTEDVILQRQEREKERREAKAR